MTMLRTRTFLDNTFRTYNEERLIYGYNDQPSNVKADLTIMNKKGTLAHTEVTTDLFLYKRTDLELDTEVMGKVREEVNKTLVTFILLKLSTSQKGNVLRLPVGIYNTKEPVFTHIKGLYTPNLHVTFTQLILALNETKLAASIHIETATGVRPITDFTTATESFPEVTSGACFTTNTHRVLGICLHIETAT